MKLDYISPEFLLSSRYASELYHSYAEGAPVVDYHNHLDVNDICADKQFKDIAGLWVTSDRYKHRAMRIAGINERYITGDASDFEKFSVWCSLLPSLIGNPLFHWSCLEMKNLFGVDEVPDKNNAEAIWNHCNGLLAQKSFSTNSILRHFNVMRLTTSDDLLDDVSRHTEASKVSGIKVTPSLRADSALAFDSPYFARWLSRLSCSWIFRCAMIQNELSPMGNGTEENESRPKTLIDSLDDYCEAIILHIRRFEENGCVIADHSLDSGFYFIRTTKDEAGKIFRRVVDCLATHERGDAAGFHNSDFVGFHNAGIQESCDELPEQCVKAGIDIPEEDIVKLKSYMLEFLAKEYAKRSWVLQLHIGAERWTSSRLRKIAGPAGGYACPGKSVDLKSLCSFLDTLDIEGLMPKIILYTLNPSDNAMLSALTGSYALSGVQKLQFGPAWWYNDQKSGIEDNLDALASYSLLFRSIGMTTDSRTILSFSRHEYFRRILCNFLGGMMSRGEIPEDMEFVGKAVEDISYRNANKWIYNEQ